VPFVDSLCPWLFYLFLPLSPQSKRKVRKGVSVFFNHLIPYYNKVTLDFLAASSNFFSNFLSHFYISLRIGGLALNILSFCSSVNKCSLFEERRIGFTKGF